MPNIPPSDRLTTNVKYEEEKFSFDFLFFNIYSLLKLFFLQTFIHSVILQHFNLQLRTFRIKMSESGPMLKNTRDFFNLDQK